MLALPRAQNQLQGLRHSTPRLQHIHSLYPLLPAATQLHSDRSTGTVALNGTFGGAEVVAGGTARVYLAGAVSGNVLVNVDGISTTWVQGTDGEC